MTWLRHGAALTILVAGYALGEQKVAFVDVQRAFLEVEEGKAAKARLQSLVESKQKEMDKEQDGLRKEKELLDKQASVMNEATRNQRNAELQKKVMDLTQKFEKSRADLASREQEETRAIFAKLQPIVAAIAQREGIDLVLDRQAVVHAISSLDLTNEVIRAYNEQAKRAAPPAPAKSAPPSANPPKKK